MLNAASAQVAQQLSNALISQGFARLQFNDKFTLNQEICEIVAKRCAIFVEHLQWVLLLHLDARLAKAMSQAILINFLQMAMP